MNEARCVCFSFRSLLLLPALC